MVSNTNDGHYGFMDHSLKRQSVYLNFEIMLLLYIKYYLIGISHMVFNDMYECN